MTYENINAIWRERDGTKFRFVVEIASGKHTHRVTVTAAALQTYSGFQRHVLESAGLLYRCDEFALGRGVGQRYWTDEVERHLEDAADRETEVAGR